MGQLFETMKTKIGMDVLIRKTFSCQNWSQRGFDQSITVHELHRMVSYITGIFSRGDYVSLSLFYQLFASFV